MIVPIRNNYLLSLALLLSVCSASAQYRPDTLSVRMYPPEAASLMTYTDYPVSYMTGTPDISIPLYTIKSGTLELPLTLKFHMGDYLRANQAAGVVGAGWSLSTDFVVTRKIKGIDDFNTNGYLYKGHLLTEYNDWDNVIFHMANGTQDGEPDRYYFRTLDGSGNFYVLDGGNRIEQVPSGPEKIDFTAGTPPINNDRFVITDGRGQVYYYSGEAGVADYTESADVHWTTWHCRKITDDTGNDAIDFNYYGIDTRVIPGVSSGITISDSLSAQPPYIKSLLIPKLETGTHDFPFFLYPNQETGMGYKWYPDSANFQRAPHPDPCAVSSHQIQRISFRGGYVTFTYSTHNRVDENGRPYDYFKVLDEIEVYNLLDIQVHSFVFYHNESIEDPYNVYLTGLTVDGTAHYSFVNPSIERGIGTSDFWGFELYDSNRRPNTVDSKVHIAPGIKFFHKGNDWDTQDDPNGPALEVDNLTQSIYKTGNGELTFKIWYPTGGRSDFIYEYDRFFDAFSNAERMISSRRIKGITFFDTGGSILKDVHFSYNGGVIIHRPSSRSSTGPVNTVLSQRIDVSTTERLYDERNRPIEPGELFSYRKRVFLSGTIFDDEFTSGNWINYPEVTATVMNGSTPMGKTIYSYDIEGPANSPGIVTYSSENAPYPIEKHYWYIGTPKSVLKYGYNNGIYSLLEKTEYSWETYLKSNYIRVARIWRAIQKLNLFDGSSIPSRNEYIDTTQILDLGHNRLLQEKKTEWLDDGTSLVTLKEYKYDNPDSLTLGRIITHFPDGNTQTEVFVHENDYSPLVNIEERPTFLTEYVRFINGIVSEGWAYNRDGSRIIGVYTLDTNILSAGSFKLSSRTSAGIFDDTGTPTAEMVLDNHYTLLDGYGYNTTYWVPNEISRRGLPTRYYTWGYGGLYPTSMTVGSQTTTASYSPLVGMTSLTTPDGINSEYTYNQYGRLIRIKTDGEKMEEYYYSLDTASTYGNQWIKTRSYLNDQSSYYADDLTWYNGLGLPAQRIQIGLNKDLIQPIEYDGMLREDARIPLPFASTNMAHRYSRFSEFLEQNQYYSSSYGSVESFAAYYGKEYELSPVGRLRSEWEPGVMGLPFWSVDGKSTTYSYVSNSTGEVRRMYCLPEGTLITVNDHAAGKFRCIVKTDPDGQTLRVYTDGLGRTVLERRNDGTSNIDTYYVYDPMGRLRWVVTPGGVDSVISDQQVSPRNNVAKRFCYYYEYDTRGNIVYKQVPGAAPIKYTYDEGDRVLTMIDGNLAASGDTLTYSYDGYGREVGRDLMGSNAGIISRTTYDVYPNLAASPFSYKSSHLSGLPSLLTTPVGRVTHTQERILGTNTFANKDFYYDRLGRVIQEVESNPESSLFVRTSRTYDLHGNVLKEKSTTYSIDGLGTVSPVDSIETQTSFDRRDRPTEQYIFFRGSTDTYPPMLYYYDDMGRLVKTMRGADLYDSYKYNIQGRETDHFFVKGHNNGDTLFVSKLRYYDPFNSDSVSRRNGSISSISSLYGNTERYTINYTYDGLGRVISALDSGLIENYYNYWDYRFSDVFTYDKNSNILTENYWFNAAALDDHYYNTNYTYTGNHRNGWTYDSNGNITAIPGQISSSSYNLINLPFTVTPTGKSTVTYHFAADGTKLSAAQNSVKYLYLGPFKYKIVGNVSPVLETVTCSGDIRIERTPSGSYERRYYVKDHLGSTRLVVNRGGTILEQADYTPYGRRIENEMLTLGNSPYLWCGKESETFIDIPWYDSGARFLTTDGIFTSVDPMSEKYYHVSHYVYCAGDPINKTDSGGTIIETLWDVFNVAMDAESLSGNIQSGEWESAFIDGIGLIFDAAAAVLPIIPGGAGSVIKAARSGDKVVETIKSVNKAAETTRSLGKTSRHSSGVKKTFQTYTKTHPDGTVYVGRTSGTNTPERNILKRDKHHHKNKEGYGPARLDKSSSNSDAIRGQEQYMIEINGGAQSAGGTSGNKINGVSPKNPKKKQYEKARRNEFNQE